MSGFFAALARVPKVRDSVGVIAQLGERLALRGYKALRHIKGRPSTIVTNRLKREFSVEQPDQDWVTDITYLRIGQGWLDLAVVMDLFSRKVVDRSMKPTLAKELVLDAIGMAVWRPRPTKKVIIHSDQGSQYGSDNWLRFCREYDNVFDYVEAF